MTTSPFRRGSLSVRLLLAALLVLGAVATGRAASDMLSQGGSGAPPPETLAPNALAANPTPTASFTGGAAPAATQAPLDLAALDDDDFKVGGGGRNIVLVRNHSDNVYRGKGRRQLARTSSERVGPVNLAYAEASCTDCQTFSIALQVAVYRRGASGIVPQNAAVALNLDCLRCVTVAVAIQYVIPVDDPGSVPDEVKQLARELDRELRDAARRKDLELAERITRLNAVIAHFEELAHWLIYEFDVDSGPETQGEDGAGVDATPLPSDADDPQATPDPSALAATPTPEPAAPAPTATDALGSPEPTPMPSAAPSDPPAPTVPPETPAPVSSG